MPECINHPKVPGHQAWMVLPNGRTKKVFVCDECFYGNGLLFHQKPEDITVRNLTNVLQTRMKGQAHNN